MDNNHSVQDSVNANNNQDKGKEAYSLAFVRVVISVDSVKLISRDTIRIKK